MGVSRSIFFLLCSVFGLVSVNILLTVIMTRSDGRFSEYTEFDFYFRINQDQYKSILHLPMDKSGRYYIHRNFIKSEMTSPSKNVILGSHCTGNHLHHLITLSETWHGPLSIVFVPGYNLETTLSLLYVLYRCFINIRERVSIHLLHPVAELPAIDDLRLHVEKAKGATISCSYAQSYIKSRTQDSYQINYARKVEYPNNLLRNIAKHSVDAQYSLIIDVDMMTSHELYREFMVFAEENALFEGGNTFYDAKSVFVLPAFEVEVESSQHLPETKAELTQLYNREKVRPFYYDICWKCQKPTDYERWKNLGTAGSDISVGYEVKWKDPWEPFFIAPTTCPDYDERFRQYGFNRISQACELHVAGFRFFVLDRGFVVHQGFKTKDSFHQSKDRENERNRILFRSFKAELKLKYPKSRKRCY